MTSIIHPAHEQHQVHQHWFGRQPHLTQFLLLALMLVATIVLAVISPLRDLNFQQAFPHTALTRWLIFPTRLLFPGYPTLLVYHAHLPVTSTLSMDWKEAGLLLGSFCLLFLTYALAMVYLPRRVSYRFIFLSTCLIGLLYLIIPIISSQDIFSYIIYARAGVVYHLNPLTALPSALPHHDPIIPYVYWKDQPSAYGPTWIAITSALQAIVSHLPYSALLSMGLLLRFWGLLMLLGSLHLIWLISGRQQQRNGAISQRTRLTAALALAWNPFLLFEGITNAHIDMTILFFILLAIFFLQGYEQQPEKSLLLASAAFALAACLKINVAILFPGLLLFLWTQREQAQHLRLQRSFIAMLVFAGTIVLLYAPFWQHGAVLYVFHINPSLTRDVNSPYNFFLRLYEGIRGKRLIRPNVDVGSPQEIRTHQISFVLFALVYAALCAWFLLKPDHTGSLSKLVGWMALVWMFYCLVGSPWFMPWYMVTFFGLAALLISMSSANRAMLGPLRLPIAVCILSFSMLSFTWFNTTALTETAIPGVPLIRLSSLGELLIWLVLLAALHYPSLQATLEQTPTANGAREIHGSG